MAFTNERIFEVAIEIMSESDLNSWPLNFDEMLQPIEHQAMGSTCTQWKLFREILQFHLSFSVQTLFERLPYLVATFTLIEISHR